MQITKQEIILLAKKLVVLGMFTSVAAVSSYLVKLNQKDVEKLKNSLNNTKIEKAIRVAAATGPNNVG